MELFIPARFEKSSKYGKGMGSKEFKKTVIITLVSVPLWGMLSIVFIKDINIILVVSVFLIAVTSVASYYFFKKVLTGRSVYDICCQIIKFFKGQKLYMYSRMKELF